MIQITTTPNNTGVTIQGDYYDLYELNESIHDLVGYETAYPGYNSTRLNCLGLAYDIRHAYMGDREIITVDNGIHTELEKWHGMILPKQNVYYGVNVIWTEVMFAVLALTDFIEMAQEPKLYAQVLSELPDEVAAKQKKRVDYAIAVVSNFQASVWQEFRNVVGENRYSRIQNKAKNPYKYSRITRYRGFCTQYIEELTGEYVNTSVEKRVPKLSKCVMNMISHPREYLQLESEIKAYAREKGIDISDVKIMGSKYPEELVW